MNLNDLFNELHKRDLFYKIENYHEKGPPIGEPNNEIIRVSIWKKVREYRDDSHTILSVVKRGEQYGLEGEQVKDGFVKDPLAHKNVVLILDRLFRSLDKQKPAVKPKKKARKKKK